MFSLAIFLTTLTCTITLSTACEYSESGFHLIPNPGTGISTEAGITACAAYGWQYANVLTANWEAASWVVGNCTTESVGIRSYNGYTDSDCQYMQASGVFGIGLGVNCTTHTGNLPLLCVESDKRLSPPMKQPKLKQLEKRSNIQTVSKLAKQDFTECAYSKDNLHLLLGPYMQSEAEAVCASNHWSLADINTSDRLSALRSVWQECDPIDATAWTSTGSVVAGGRCQFVYFQGLGAMWLMVSEGDHPCDLPTANILCQE